MLNQYKIKRQMLNKMRMHKLIKPGVLLLSFLFYLLLSKKNN